jgi:hypothetical protein
MQLSPQREGALMNNSRTLLLLSLLFAVSAGASAGSGPALRSLALRDGQASTPADTSLAGSVAQRSFLGLDIIISNDGFGLGGFFRKEFSEDWSGFVSFSVSESKDDREVERIDPYYGVSYTPGKLSRFLVMPVLVGVQRRLFREDITDTFRPYLNAGVGPALVFAAPYVEWVNDGTGYSQLQDVEFFKSLGRGRAHYTVSSFVGVGANFGSDRSSVFGLNFRYYFTYLFGDGLPSLYDTNTGAVVANKKSFGGFAITLNFGMGS